MTELIDSVALREEMLRDDPRFRAEWERTAFARNVALRLVGYRVEHHLSMDELAERVDVPISTIEKLEIGEETPELGILLQLSAKLGLEFLIHVVPCEQPPTDIPDGMVESVRGNGSSALVAAR